MRVARVTNIAEMRAMVFREAGVLVSGRWCQVLKLRFRSSRVEVWVAWRMTEC